MKKYSQLFLLSSAFLSILTAQTTVQASDNTPSSSNPTTLASDVTVNVSGNSVSINYIRSQAQNPYTISHAVWSDENGQDDLKWYSASQTSTTVDLSQHSGYGTFHVHTYININGNLLVKQKLRQLGRLGKFILHAIKIKKILKLFMPFGLKKMVVMISTGTMLNRK